MIQSQPQIRIACCDEWKSQTNMHVKGTEWVIKYIQISTKVACPGDADSLFLTTTQCDSSFTNLCFISSLQHSDVIIQTTGVNNTLIFVLVIFLTKHNVVLQCLVLFSIITLSTTTASRENEKEETTNENPWCLWDVCNRMREMCLTTCFCEFTQE